MGNKKLNIIIFVLLVILFVLCISYLIIIKLKNNKYEKYEDCIDISISLEDTLKQKENSYYVLFYMNDCSQCNMIESNIIAYINNKDKDYQLYLLSSDAYIDVIVEFDDSGECIENYLVDDVSKLRISSVPLLLFVENKKINQYFIGSSKILSELEGK